MKQTLANRFERIVNENLPKRKEMIKVLKESALNATLFSEKGHGLKSVLVHTGRITDFKGLYGFVEDNKIVYIDESSYVFKRIIRELKGNTKYQLKLAHRMIEYNSASKPNYNLVDALEAMNKMKIIYMDLPDDLERKITVLYLHCQYECLYNRFE